MKGQGTRHSEADRSGLMSRLRGLVGRVLFFESKFLPSRRIVGMRYLKLDEQSPGELLSALVGIGSKLSLHGIRPEDTICSWTWFEPDPVGMEEDAIERLVQSRRMNPLRVNILLCRAGWGEEMRAFVVPKRVLARPAAPDRPRGYLGEPWCHRCNETFFWDPNVEEAPWCPVGAPGSFVQGVRCLKCGLTSPAELVPWKREFRCTRT